MPQPGRRFRGDDDYINGHFAETRHISYISAARYTASAL